MNNDEKQAYYNEHKIEITRKISGYTLSIRFEPAVDIVNGDFYKFTSTLSNNKGLKNMVVDSVNTSIFSQYRCFPELRLYEVALFSQIDFEKLLYGIFDDREVAQKIFSAYKRIINDYSNHYPLFL